MIIRKIAQLGKGLAHKLLPKPVNAYLTVLLVFVVLLVTPQPVWAWDYTNQIMDNASRYENSQKLNRIVDEAVKDAKSGKRQRPDPRKTERFQQCDKQRQQCTQCLFDRTVDTMACHNHCEDQFSRCMAAADTPSESNSSFGRDPSQTNAAKLKEMLLPAAEQGNTDAQYMVAVLYYLGMDTEPDPDNGLGWLMKSKAGGNETASRLYEKVNALQFSSLLNSNEYMLYQQLYPEERQRYLDQKTAQRAQELSGIVQSFLNQEAQR